MGRARHLLANDLSRPFDTSAEFWLNAHRAVDLWDAAEAVGDAVSLIKPLRVTARITRAFGRADSTRT